MPWPETSTATRRGTARPRATSRTPESVASSTARCSNRDRPCTSACATSPRGSPPDTAVIRPTWASSASGVAAETNHASVPAGSRAGSVPLSGACSSTTWALVPLIPNADTAARRGRSRSGHFSAAVTNRTGPAAQSTADDGASAPGVAGTIPCRMACTIAITPAAPAAAWVWPRLALTEPSSSSSDRSP